MAVQIIEYLKGGDEMMSDDMLSQEEIEALLRGETLDDKDELKMLYR